MSYLKQPSTATVRDACASHTAPPNDRSAGHRARGRTQALIRLLIVSVAILGTMAIATPASAQEAPEPAAVEYTTGDAIAEFAMGYLGYPYVWAANGPSAFDCSGFTQFVVANTVGIDIGHGTAGQTNHGAWVDWGGWQAGDLVFFANTYGSGISHVGIYIGDGQFIHAENESTGVTISSLYSNYYSGHYYGAVRIG